MTIVEFISVFMSSVGVSAGSASWLAKRLFDHRLAKDIEKVKADFQAQLDHEKTILEGNIREKVETILGERAAEREYVLEARKRLYAAVGPLRFQLLLACRNLAGRVMKHGQLPEPYSTDIHGYYGESTLFRILRPLALAELTERQITIADFSVDTSSVGLLRFKKAAYAAFSGTSLVKGHPQVNWDVQEQHVFFDYLSRASNALIIQEGERERCMRVDEFQHYLHDRHHENAFDPFPKILNGFSPRQKPLFWLRLVGYAHLCIDYVNNEGKGIGFEVRTFPVEELLRASGDPEIIDKINDYAGRCQALQATAL